VTQFTNRKIGVVREMNIVLLENVWYLLFNASLDKLFWAEGTVYTSHLLNMISTTAIGGKTPLEIWSS